ncbi:MAG TPA: ATP-binding cassette domain-containing protein [Terracidiphilus sp.]|nr:ATP-binding cassette domain-containing protein [Terracidiphilus sp.]
MVSAALKLEPELEPQPLELTVEMPASCRIEIALREVSVAYPCGREGVKTVLSGINLQIAQGEFVAILGETGCGKSTMLRLILGQEFPTSGAVEVDSKPVTKIDARCGYVPQKYSLFPDRTVLGNVIYGPENAKSGLPGRLRPSFWRFRKQLRAEAAAYLQRMGLRAQDLNKYPHQLSGGMQQRVAIAQALLMKPPVLLMDEAFSALDPSTRSSLQEQLHIIWRESRPTIVFVTHNTQEALLLGTRLILLGRHQEEQAQQSNVLLDLEIPTARLPFARRAHSAEFQDLHEYVKQIAYKSSSMNREEDAAQPLTSEGNLQ